MNCAKARRRIEAAEDGQPRLAAHLEGCEPCRLLAAEQELPGRLFRQAGAPEGLDRLRLGLAESVMARLAGETRAPERIWLRPVVLGAAALLAVLAFLLTFQPLLPDGGGGELGSPRVASGPRQAPAVIAAEAGDEHGMRVSRSGDSVEILLDRNGDRVHQVAVSTSPDFSRQRVTRFRGTRWVDPAPAPIVGGVVFYRID